MLLLYVYIRHFLLESIVTDSPFKMWRCLRSYAGDYVILIAYWCMCLQSQINFVSSSIISIKDNM